jgi:hypothetical protein
MPSVKCVPSTFFAPSRTFLSTMSKNCWCSYVRVFAEYEFGHYRVKHDVENLRTVYRTSPAFEFDHVSTSSCQVRSLRLAESHLTTKCLQRNVSRLRLSYAYRCRTGAFTIFLCARRNIFEWAEPDDPIFCHVNITGASDAYRPMSACAFSQVQTVNLFSSHKKRITDTLLTTDKKKGCPANSTSCAI